MLTTNEMILSLQISLDTYLIDSSCHHILLDSLLVTRMWHCWFNWLHITWLGHWLQIIWFHCWLHWLHMVALGRLTVLVLTQRYSTNLLGSWLWHCWASHWLHITWFIPCWLHWLQMCTFGNLTVLVITQGRSTVLVIIQRHFSCTLPFACIFLIIIYITLINRIFIWRWHYRRLFLAWGHLVAWFWYWHFLLRLFLQWMVSLDVYQAGTRWNEVQIIVRLYQARFNSGHTGEDNTAFMACNMECYFFWTLGICTTNNVQDPITLILSVVYVPIWNLLLGSSFYNVGSYIPTCRHWQALWWYLCRSLILSSNTGSSYDLT